MAGKWELVGSARSGSQSETLQVVRVRRWGDIEQMLRAVVQGEGGEGGGTERENRSARGGRERVEGGAALKCDFLQPRFSIDCDGQFK